MIQHLALFKFSSETTNKQKNEAMERIENLKNEIDGIINLSIGHNFSDRSQGYEIGLTVTLQDKNSLEIYGHHPKHLEVIDYLKEIGLENVIVLDYEITK